MSTTSELLAASLDPTSINALPALIDAYVETRETRLSLERQAEALKKQETQYKDRIEKILKTHNLTVGGGGKYKAKIEQDDKPTVSDWGKLYAHIAATGEWDLLQRRLTENSVKARWEEKISIPGVDKFPVTKLSITKT